ncbi:G-type lectin S-receptor-like serine/threonine-protein kinase-like protein [Drosera capensis]
MSMSKCSNRSTTDSTVFLWDISRPTVAASRSSSLRIASVKRAIFLLGETQLKVMSSSAVLNFIIRMWEEAMLAMEAYEIYTLDTINVSHPVYDGETLVSACGNFELGFFSPANSSWRFVGIWYKKISVPTVVWVANRHAPLLDTSGVLKVVKATSSLVLFDGNGTVIWSANSSRFVQEPVAQILDCGNLVIINKDDNLNDDNFLWQSFDHPCDVLLPGMQLGWNLVTGLNRNLTSWSSSDDPSPGGYTYKVDISGYPQLVLMKGSIEQFRNGPWNGVRFAGNLFLKANPVFNYTFVLNDNEIYYTYRLVNISVISHVVLTQDGTVKRLVWSDESQGWILYISGQRDSCDTYGVCSAYGSCNMGNTPECGCLKGFVPKSVADWNSGDWSGGCVRKKPLTCHSKDGFLTVHNAKLPDTRYSWYSLSMTLEDCKKKCIENCSCVAYSNIFITNGTGCLLWFDALLDLQVYAQSGQDLYVRLPASELGMTKKEISIIVSFTLFGALLLGAGITLTYWRWMNKREEKVNSMEEHDSCQKDDPELPLFEFSVISQVTNYFSDSNKLGEGGFGSVYKGVLEGGQEVAVKRLSKDSVQGLDEFKNEVLCIAKLQHRNLVRLLGCSIYGDERLLIYEYMPNKSLDYFIFGSLTYILKHSDETKSILLDWPKRFQIINGIARGLLYLHQDSRLRIIHRDLKASNVLLDCDLNPKISDFGMARSFDGNETEAQTMRVVGTFGYMPPEYAIDGHFSVKSDVFSFGVMLLEIVSGKRNRGFNHPDHFHNLVGHAWRLSLVGGSLELVDPVISSTCDPPQALRAIHTGLLCVQQDPDDRPTMSTVMVMLDTDCELPEPKMPGFFIGRTVVEEYSLGSTNSTDLSAGLLHGRARGGKLPISDTVGLKQEPKSISGFRFSVTTKPNQQ